MPITTRPIHDRLSTSPVPICLHFLGDKTPDPSVSADFTYYSRLRCRDFYQLSPRADKHINIACTATILFASRAFNRVIEFTRVPV